ncbi:hypothetical protein [Aliikangiella sp. G2MR2-5]|uniref:hypothetical protein n=1 Tax=Aliikangiella sp. G2MR2-5 TaxID=2788943 RepID=UPI0018AC8353|nr:hypothetical protein [Aliikangiella sp. G2MR2-5]
MKVTAELEVQLNDDEGTRCYSFYPEWMSGVELAKYENGSGDDLIILFYKNNIIVKGFDHESEVSPHAREKYGIWPGIYDGLSEELLDLLDDEALMKEHVTFCYWLLDGDDEWIHGPVKFENEEDDGSSWLLKMIPFNSFQFKSWAQYYYGENADKLEKSRIEAVFEEDNNSALSSVFYCTYQNGEEVDSSNPIKINILEAKRLCENVISGTDNFIGFVDEEGTTLQFYSDKKGVISADIPIVAEKGSLVCEISYSEFMVLIDSLEQPFKDYANTLDMNFQPW